VVLPVALLNDKGEAGRGAGQGTQIVFQGLVSSSVAAGGQQQQRLACTQLAADAGQASACDKRNA
jgi:hypothetical protein